MSARTAHGWLLSVGAVLSMLSPSPPAGAEELSSYSGAQLYRRFCAACHGLSGHGDGPVASDMSVAVPDITRIAKRRGGVFPVADMRRVIDGRAVHPAHGVRLMPVWGYQFGIAQSTATPSSTTQSTDEMINRLVAYIQSIQSK
jgi:mono/diheme cytochrome c family protein